MVKSETTRNKKGGIVKTSSQRVLISQKIRSLPGYRDLLSSYRSLVDDIEREGELGMYGSLVRWGICDNPSRPLSFYLTVYWCRQRYYGDSDAELTSFLAEARNTVAFMTNELQGKVLG